jgi:ATP-dependent Zn protease
MLCELGMDASFGLAVCTGTDRQALYPVLRERINGVLAHELHAAVALIEKNRAAIDALVTALLDKNHLRSEEIRAIFEAHVKL